MKVLGHIIVWASLCVGVCSAATAYLVSLELPDAELLDLTLAAHTGSSVQADGRWVPIGAEGSTISNSLLTNLRAAGVHNCRVREFSFYRWRGKWHFAGALGGLLCGAVLVRAGARRKHLAASGDEKDLSPFYALHSLHGEIEHLRLVAPKMSEGEALDLIALRIGELQKTQMPAFVDAREKLIGSLGLGGYASLMDSFAAAERQINRAWSAAVDQVYDEAVICLDEAAQRLEQSYRKLRAGDDSLR